MSQGTVLQRLDRLEKLVEGVVHRLSSAESGPKDWRRTIGMFDGDPVMGGIIDEALRAREQERQRFHEEYERETRPS